MKNLFIAGCFLFLVSCDNTDEQAKRDSLKTDSFLRAQTNIVIPADSSKTDTMKMVALPPVFIGDIVMQNTNDPRNVELGKITGSKYNNVGMIFIRPKDHSYMVAEMKDSATITPLSEWTQKGEGGHFVVLRLKDSNRILNEKKTTELKKGAKNFRGLRYDEALSWADDAVYGPEMVWKMYNLIRVKICEPGKIGDLKLDGTATETAMKKKYGKVLPKEEQFVSPDAIYKSPSMVITYEH